MKKFVTYAPPQGTPTFPRFTEQFGYTFDDGKPVSVQDAGHIAKFSTNPLFVVSDDASKAKRAEGAADLDAANARIEQLETTIAKGTAENEGLRADLKAAHETIAPLEDAVAAAAAEITALKKPREELKCGKAK